LWSICSTSKNGKLARIVVHLKGALPCMPRCPCYCRKNIEKQQRPATLQLRSLWRRLFFSGPQAAIKKLQKLIRRSHAKDVLERTTLLIPMTPPYSSTLRVELAYFHHNKKNTRGPMQCRERVHQSNFKHHTHVFFVSL
jgi:hypothetical protein